MVFFGGVVGCRGIKPVSVNLLGALDDGSDGGVGEQRAQCPDAAAGAVPEVGGLFGERFGLVGRERQEVLDAESAPRRGCARGIACEGDPALAGECFCVCCFQDGIGGQPGEPCPVVGGLRLRRKGLDLFEREPVGPVGGVLDELAPFGEAVGCCDGSVLQKVDTPCLAARAGIFRRGMERNRVGSIDRRDHQVQGSGVDLHQFAGAGWSLPAPGPVRPVGLGSAGHGVAERMAGAFKPFQDAIQGRP